jgi:hypothetical protein
MVGLIDVCVLEGVGLIGSTCGDVVECLWVGGRGAVEKGRDEAHRGEVVC